MTCPICNGPAEPRELRELDVYEPLCLACSMEQKIMDAMGFGPADFDADANPLYRTVVDQVEARMAEVESARGLDVMQRVEAWLRRLSTRTSFTA